ncbi:glycosidase [Algibacter marinivivus]|uniref:Glycosidase n=1 Tax=Algibacter marinivivus TaxID=2100723 RepID=A0A2U2XA13_9FLAO|nr:glycosidase [Algibacter marinivivus]PWH84580.1 glycosidase [Algibacter marinivivus]
MNKNFLKLAIVLFSTVLFAQADKVAVQNNSNGMYLTVNGENFMVNGMNWDYFPIGTNYSYSLWNQSDDVIKSALDAEMGLLKNMGVNTVRMYTGVQPKWIKYIYEKHGIRTMLNHSFGRYGLTLNGAWTPVTDYRDEATKELLLSEVTKLAEDYKDTPGLLLFLLGNENNYGLFWAGAETEDFPDEEDKKREVGEKRGRPMYKLMNDAALKMKSIDSSHPVAICNGDVLFLDIVAEECKDVDIYGVNMYRGVTFTDAFDTIKEKFKKPVLLTEFGADAFNAIENQEDQKSQAFYMVNNWKDIYENAAGMGRAENVIGGFTFQFSDGWWKFGQTKNLDVHDNNASWANGGYYLDMEAGNNNMNEEWFGICAKGPTNARGTYTLYPRAAYYALKEVHTLNPYDEGVDVDFLKNHFKNVNLMDAVLKARGDKAALGGGEKIKISNLRAEFTTFNTGGKFITTPDNDNPDDENFPNQLGFDHMQSYFIGVEGNPTANMSANVNFNILGNVAGNPIDEIFYENRGRVQKTINSNGEEVIITDPNRVQIYNAEFEWKGKDADVRGFYRTGHYHWGYEGDFFGLYRGSFYGPNLDIYNGEIFGFEIDGKGAFNGLKAAFGPQLWWGANPAVLLKYSTKLGHWDASAIFHEDIDNIGNAISSIAIPVPRTRRASLHFKRKFGSVGFEVGGLWGGQPLNGRTFQVAEGESGNYTILEDKIGSEDNWGAKAKVTYQKGSFNWYALGASTGLVANGGADETQTFAGWKLKDNGSGNQNSFLTGFTYSIGDLQIAPNFLWQEPLVDAMPNDMDPNSAGRLRNIQDDPFAVRGNRKTTAGELLLTYDPTPGSWYYEWDNDRAEDAKFAMNLGFVFRHLPTTMDAAIGFLANRQSFAFGAATPAEDLWEVHSRIVSKTSPDFGFIANLFAGNAQANGSDARLIERYGGDVRMIYNNIKITAQAKFNDWGPFDYHRDFNQTFPEQFMLDISTTLGKPDWFILPDTKIGIRGTWRSIDQYSGRYNPTQTIDITGNSVPDPNAIGFDNGNEWEIRTYVHINIGK